LHFCLVKCMGEISIGGVVMIRSGPFINWIIVRALAIGFRSFFVFLKLSGTYNTSIHCLFAVCLFAADLPLLLPSSASSAPRTTRTPTLAPARLRFASSCLSSSSFFFLVGTIVISLDHLFSF
jgi:hypothetical protein